MNIVCPILLWFVNSSRIIGLVQFWIKGIHIGEKVGNLTASISRFHWHRNELVCCCNMGQSFKLSSNDAFHVPLIILPFSSESWRIFRDNAKKWLRYFRRLREVLHLFGLSIFHPQSHNENDSLVDSSETAAKCPISRLMISFCFTVRSCRSYLAESFLIFKCWCEILCTCSAHSSGNIRNNKWN